MESHRQSSSIVFGEDDTERILVDIATLEVELRQRDTESLEGVYWRPVIQGKAVFSDLRRAP